MERTYKASSASTESREEKIIMTTEKIRVGIIGASMRSGWGRDAHIPALSALPEFEITAVSTSRQETADETAKHFGIPHAFADPYKLVQHPEADLVSICATPVLNSAGNSDHGAFSKVAVRQGFGQNESPEVAQPWRRECPPFRGLQRTFWNSSGRVRTSRFTAADSTETHRQSWRLHSPQNSHHLRVCGGSSTATP